MPPSILVKPAINYDYFWLALILLLAGYLRFNNLDYMEFKTDEATYLFLVRDFIFNGHIPLTGITNSSGIKMPPFLIYLLSFPFIICRNPPFIAGFSAFLDILAVGLCFYLCRKFFNLRAAIFSSLMYACNPGAILYARKFWVIPFFILLFFSSLFIVIKNRKYRFILFSFLLLGLTLQLHAQILVYIILFLILLSRIRPPLPWRYLLKGIGIMLLVFIPYDIYLISNHTNLFNGFLTTPKQPLSVYLHSLYFPFLMSSPAIFWQNPSPGTPWTILSMFVSFISCVFIFFRNKDKGGSLLVLWLWGFLVLVEISMFFLKIIPNFIYFISIYPVIFISSGLFFDFLIEKCPSNIFIKVLLYASLSIFLICQFYVSFQYFGNYIKVNSHIEEYGPPFYGRVQEIKKLLNKGIRDPEIIQNMVGLDAQDHSFGKYDYEATKYIVDNINEIKLK